MDKLIIDDELWAPIEPLLPPAKPRRFKYPGRKQVPDRAALTGILFVLKTGIRWGYTISVVFVSASSVVPTFTKPFSNLAVA